MVDYRVTFKGDLGNLAQFDAAIRNSVTQSARAIEQANKSLLSQVGNFQGIFNPSTSGAGLFAKNLKTEIDSVNRTFIQSGEAIRRVTSGFEIITTQATKTKAAVSSIQEQFATQYESPYKKIIGDLDAYEAALKKIGPTEQRILADREATLNRQLPLYNKINDLEQKRFGLEQRIGQVQETHAVVQQPIETQLAAARTARRAVDPADTAAIKEANAQVKLLREELARLKAAEATALQPLTGALNEVNAKIDQTTAKIEKLEASQLSRAAGLRSLNPGYAEKDAALIATPPIQKDLQSALNLSKDFRSKLLSLGLGGGAGFGTQEFQENLAKQEAALTRFTENARTNVKTVQGSFRDNIGRGATGILKDFTIELDKNNNVVGRWGGQLAGAGTFLRQTVRDFQKVVEWTVATTVVFGTLAAVVKQLGSINDLNTSLTRLSITAQTSSQDTQGLFEQIGQVAVQTATPVKDLVKAADDIALAVRKAGDTTDEFHGKIIDLTRAVGIFTNLTGTDTVQATDQLSAAFKQLNIEPAQLVGILSKVTAVAGGQSTAINDIVKGLSGLAEAAKAAGLSVDEQIASIQVLSQVTNKTSDEVATSFKNLFGSVSSVGSEKILKEFGINIRDSTGGLKGFLDIYKEVKDAIDSGVIPQNRLPDVLRGISGGPRRAPDAAALLANLDKIFQVVGKSANATNEALVANAKILDTNAAKITQFQNAVDIAIFQKFGSVVKDLTESLVGIGTVAANLFSGIPTEIVSLTVKLGALVLIIKTLGSVAKITGISGALGELARGFKLAGTEASVAATKISSASAATSSTGGIINKFSANKKLLGLGAGIAVGGALAASGGISDTNSVGSTAQLVGSLALLVPGLQEVGIALLAGGTALQVFSGDSTKAAKSSEDLTKDVLTLTDSLRASQTDANNFAEAQSKAAAQIDEISVKTKKTVNDQKLLAAATDDYVTATLGLANANQTVAKTFDDLLKTLPGLSKEYKDFIGLTKEQLGSKQIQDLRNQLVQDLLKATGQDIFTGTPLKASSVYTPNNGTGTVAQFNAPYKTQEFQFYGGGNQAAQYNQQPSIDLSQLLNKPDLLKRIFNVNNGQGTTYNIPQNQVALGYLQGALAEISTDLQKYGVSQEQYDNLTKSITTLAGNVGTSAQNTSIIGQTNATVQANTLLGIFKGAEADNAALDVKLLDLINKTQQNAPPTPESTLPAGGNFAGNIDTSQTREALQQLQKAFADIQAAALAGLQPTNQQLISIAENTFKAEKSTQGLGSLYDDLKAAGNDALAKGILNYLAQAGVSTQQLDDITKLYGLTLKDVGTIADDLSASFDKARTSAAQAFASRALQLQIAKNAGDFKDNAKGLKILTDQNNQALASNNALINSISTLSSSAMVDLNQQLSNIIGLQGQYLTQTDLSTLSTADLADRVTETTNKLLENAVAAGVNADGIKKIQLEVAKLIGIINAIPTYKQVIIDVQTRLTQGGSGAYPSGGFNAIQQELDQAKANDAANTKAQQDAFKQIQDMINKILGTGKGGALGKTPKTKAAAKGPDVSEIDLPDEIANAVNRNELIQEAIRRARALQKTVPGANLAASDDIVALLKGTQNILNVRGVKDDFLRRALEELADIEKKRLEFETKADTIRRIRIGAGDFSAIANVPINSKTGVSLGGPQGPISISLNVAGQILTPAQLAQFADLVASALKRQIANG